MNEDGAQDSAAYEPTDAELVGALRARLAQLAGELDKAGQPELARFARESIALRGGQLMPAFRLVASDSVAPELVGIWIKYNEAAGVNAGKLASARVIRASMEEWQREHGTKLPD